MAQFETKRRGKERRERERRKRKRRNDREKERGKTAERELEKNWSGPGERFPRDLHDGKIVAITALKTDPPLKNVRTPYPGRRPIPAL